MRLWVSALELRTNLLCSPFLIASCSKLCLISSKLFAPINIWHREKQLSSAHFDDSKVIWKQQLWQDVTKGRQLMHCEMLFFCAKEKPKTIAQTPNECVGGGEAKMPSSSGSIQMNLTIYSAWRCRIISLHSVMKINISCSCSSLFTPRSTDCSLKWKWGAKLYWGVPVGRRSQQ